ncbi:MAG: CNNM domain-containing protein, partial [Bdellovibrionota bacterium]
MSLFYFFALAISICGYGFFVLFKLSVSRASLSVVERFQEEGVWGSRLALRILTNADKHILAAHIGRFLCTLGSGVWLLLISKSWLSVVSAEGITSLHGISSLGLFVLFVLFITFVTVLFAQVLGAVGMVSPEKVLLSLGWLGEAFTAVLRPLQVPIQLMLQFVERSGQINSIPSAREITLSAEDLESVIEHSTQAGALDDSESELLYGALRLSEIRACEIMTPRADIVSIGAETSLDELRRILSEAGFSRVLVTGDHLDDVRGMLLAKDLMSLIGCEVENFSIVPYIRQVAFVDGELRGDDVLKRLRASQAHLAVVLDEHGGVDGIKPKVIILMIGN